MRNNYKNSLSKVTLVAAVAMGSLIMVLAVLSKAALAQPRYWEEIVAACKSQSLQDYLQQAAGGKPDAAFCAGVLMDLEASDPDLAQDHLIAALKSGRREAAYPLALAVRAGVGKYANQLAIDNFPLVQSYTEQSKDSVRQALGLYNEITLAVGLLYGNRGMVDTACIALKADRDGTGRNPSLISLAALYLQPNGCPSGLIKRNQTEAQYLLQPYVGKYPRAASLMQHLSDGAYPPPPVTQCSYSDEASQRLYNAKMLPLLSAYKTLPRWKQEMIVGIMPWFFACR